MSTDPNIVSVNLIGSGFLSTGTNLERYF